MKFRLAIFLSLLSVCTSAQESNPAGSLLTKLDTLKLPSLNFTKSDTLLQNLNSKIDSLEVLKSKAQEKLNRLNPLNSVRQTKEKLDSVNSSLASKVSGQDTLPVKNQITRYNKKLDSTRTQLQSRLDSLSQLKLDIGMIKGMDSLKLRLDSLKNGGPIKDIKKAEAKLAEMQLKVGSKVAGVEQRINENTEMFSAQGLDVPTVNLPGTDLTKLNVPALNVPGGSMPNQPQLNMGNGLNLPGAELPVGNMPTINTPNLDVGDLADEAKGKLPELNTDAIKGMGKIKDLKEEIGKVGEVGNEIKGYQEDLKKIREGKLDELNQLPQEAEAKAMELAGDEFAQRAAMLEKWKADPAYAKELALNEAKEQAINHFAGKEQELMAAMEQLSKLKSKYSDAEGVLDLFKKRQRPLAGKTFVERLMPGINIQVQSGSNVWMDFNPYIGYQISRKFMAGAGWNERLSVNFKQLSVVTTERIFGPRTYVEFKAKENLVLKVESEWMHASVHTPMQVFRGESPSRQWVWSTFGGIKNVFNLSKKWKGHVEILYNLYNPEKRSPYSSNLNVRFGFGRKMVKKERK
jgi:hypothetical protein